MTERVGTLKVDAEFRRLVLPCSGEEYAVLERQILGDGCPSPVVVWCGCIVSGYEQYEICRANNVAYSVRNIGFCVREEVISMICRMELGGRVLPENQCRYLIGKRYNADIVIGAHHAAGTDQFKERAGRELSKGKRLYESSAGQTRERLAEEYGVNKCSVLRYSLYAQAIDYIASMKEEAADRILAGSFKVPMEAVMACYGKSERDVEKLLAPSGRRTRVKPAAPAKEEPGSITVKDMPAFDPDAEINSLALTIPSWISSIDRTGTAADFSILTSEGRDRLERRLHLLQRTTRKMLHALKEVR